jgi:hypothetical protein
MNIYQIEKQTSIFDFDLLDNIFRKFIPLFHYRQLLLQKNHTFDLFRNNSIRQR